jgi:hypothetical protein
LSSIARTVEDVQVPAQKFGGNERTRKHGLACNNDFLVE